MIPFDIPPKSVIWTPPKPAIIRAAPDRPQGMLDGLFDRGLLVGAFAAAAARGLRAAAGVIWRDAYTATLNHDNGGGWNGYTLRGFIPQADLTQTGGTKIRLTLQAKASGNTRIAKMYVGPASASYSATSPAFASTPTQILFSTAAATTISGGAADLVTDEAVMSLPVSDGLIYTMYIDQAGVDFREHQTLPSGGKVSYKAGDDGATVSASGYTDYTFNTHSFTVKKIEVYK